MRHDLIDLGGYETSDLVGMWQAHYPEAFAGGNALLDALWATSTADINLGPTLAISTATFLAEERLRRPHPPIESGQPFRSNIKQETIAKSLRRLVDEELGQVLPYVTMDEIEEAVRPTLRTLGRALPLGKADR